MKKGFTLVEIMAVILILGVILVIAIPTFNKVVEESKNKLYKNLNETVVKTTKTYATENAFLMPTEEGESVEVTVNELISTGYLKELKNPEDKEDTCNGYIIITRLADEQYAYNPHINCSTDIASSTEDGLVLHYTFDDFQEPTTNLIPGGLVNSYPSVGNTHGTYNVNQHNNYVYFSIGTIGSITNNVVTLSTIGRPIYTYDVLTPQTSGGGVTAGVNYFIKKVSANSFTLHQYNSSQNGSQGFAVHNSINNDIRININATNFPTMWIGPPHLANSALVKEIIPNCFSSSGELHDCVRLNTDHKLYGAIDYMAYGVYPPVVKDKKYTFSFYYRAANEASIGTVVSFSCYTSAGWANKASVPATMQWQRFTVTSTAPNTGGTNLYFNISKRGKIDISEIQTEEKLYSTPFVVGSRTGTVKDYSANNNNSSLDSTYAPKWIYDSERKSGYYEFDGVDKYISTTPLSITSDITISLWINRIGTTNTFVPLIEQGGTRRFRLTRRYNQLCFGNDATTSNYYCTSTSFSETNKWYHIVATSKNGVYNIYVNGVNYRLGQSANSYASWSVEKFNVGYRPYDNSVGPFNGYIDDIRIYNRALSDQEVTQIYNLTKY